MSLPSGSRLGRFEITGVLGEGAMGTYFAHDPPDRVSPDPARVFPDGRQVGVATTGTITAPPGSWNAEREVAKVKLELKKE